MISSFRRSIASLVCAVMAFQPLAASYAASQQYRIPLRLGDVTSQVELELTPSPVDFEDVAVGQVRTLEAKLRNNGSADARGVTLNTMAPFSVDASACTYVPAGGDCSVWLSFAPGGAGRAIGALNIASGTTSLQSILLGNGLGLIADLDVSDGGGWNFGQVELDTKSDVKTLTLRNTGTAALPLSSVGLLKGSDEYKLTHTCTDSLAPGASCEVTVWFEPTEFGQRLGAFRVKSADGSVRDVWLLGFGGVEQPSPEQTQGKLSAATELDFGAVVLPTPGQVRTLTLANTGATLLTLSPLVLSGTDTSAFALKSECGLTLAPYSSCTVHLTFTPTALAKYAAQLEFSAGEAESLQARTIAIRGAGVTTPSGLIASPTAVDFGSTTKLSGIEKVVRLTNTADEPQTLRVSYASNPQNFVVLGGCEAAIASEASCDLRLLYQAYSPNRADGELILLTATGQSLTVPLTGAVPTPVLIVSPSALVFGTTNVEVASPAKNVVLKNTGLAPVELTSVSIAGGNEFVQASACGESIAPGTSCSVPVTFTPYASKKRASSLVIESNDPESARQEVTLEGWGQIGALSAQPTSLYFSTIETQTEEKKAFTLSNRGPGTVRIPRMAITGAGASGYSQTHTCQELLAVGQTCEVSISFKPVQVRSYAAQLEVYTGDGVSASIWLNGWGHAPKEGKLDVFPNPVDFGSVSIYRPASKVIQFKNTGTADLRVTSVSLSGADAALITQDDNCVSVIAAGATCLVTLTGALSQLRTYSAQLDILVEGSNAQTVAIAASGVELLSDAQLTVTPGLVDFGQIVVGIPVARTLSVKNTGVASATLVAAELSNPALTLTSECRGELEPGASCEFGLQLKTNQSVSTALTLRTQEGHRVAVPVKATIPVPVLVVAPASLAFVATAIDAQSEPQSLRLFNEGDAALNIDSIRLQGTHNFGFVLDNQCGSVLSPARSCDVVVMFSPQAAGAHLAEVVIASNDEAAPFLKVPLTGSGLADPEKMPVLLVSPNTLAFDATVTGKTASLLNIRLANIGRARLSILGLELLDETDFAQSNNCGESLAPGESCQVNVLFTPTVSGPRSTDLIIASDASNNATYAVSVSGMGLKPELEKGPVLSVNSATLVFQASPIGVSAPLLTIDLTNSGTALLFISELGLQEEIDFAQTNTCGESLAPGQSCQVSVRFTPTEPDLRSTNLVVASNASNGKIYEVSLRGRGFHPNQEPSYFALSSADVDFGTVEVGAKPTKLLTLKNIGERDASLADIYLSGINQDIFGLNRNACGNSLAPAQECAIVVQFSPLQEGVHNATLEILPTLGTPVIANLSGNGHAEKEVEPKPQPANLSLTPETVDFGTVAQGATPSLALTLKNKGSHDAALANIYLAGQDRDKFILDRSACGELLISAQECSIVVRFLPTEAGAHGAALEIIPVTGIPVIARLTGSGPAAQARVSPLVLHFGDQPMGMSTQPQIVSITNSGTVSLRINSLQLVEGAGSFTVRSACPPMLEVGKSCEGLVSFKPNMAGAVTGVLRVTTGHSGGPVNVVLTATGLKPTASIMPTRVDFGRIYVNKSQTQLIQLTNTSDVALVVQGVGLTDSSAQNGFSTTNACQEGVAAHASCDILVTARPDVAGLKSNALVVKTTAGVFTVPVSVEGALMALGTITPAQIPAAGGSVVTISGAGFVASSHILFDGVRATSLSLISATQLVATAPAHAPGKVTVTLTDDGATPVSKANALEYVAAPEIGSISPSSGSIGGGWSAVLTGTNFVPGLQVFVEGQPATIMRHISATQVEIRVPARRAVMEGLVDVKVTSVGGSSTLTGGLRYVVPPAQLELTGASGQFGDISRDGRYAQTAVLRNAGTSAVRLSSIEFSSSVSGVFTRTAGTCSVSFPAELAQGATCSIELSAFGAALGQVSGELRVTSDIPADGLASLTLSAKVIEPDYSLSGSPGVMSLASGNFGITAALSEDGRANLPLTRTVYLNNSFNVVGTRISDIAITLEGREVEEFQIVEVLAVSDSGASRSAGAVISPDGRSASNALVDDGNGAYPHLAVKLQYAPRAAGEHNTQLSIAFNSGRVVGLPLYGQAKYLNVAEVSGDGDFGVNAYSDNAQAVQSTTKTFSIRSAEAIGKLLRVSQLRLIGAEAPAFEIAGFTGRTSDEPLGVQEVSPNAMVQASAASVLTVSVRFTPLRIGAHSAQLVIQSNTDGAPLFVDLTGVGARDVVLELSEGAGISPPTDYPMTGINASIVKDAYLRNTGSVGRVIFTGMQIVGSPAFTLVDYGRAANVAKTTVTKPAAGARYMNSTFQGDDAAGSGAKDFFSSIRFAPLTVGMHEAIVTVWHDAPGEFTTFMIKGEAVRAAAVLSNSATLPVIEPNADFGIASFNGPGHASNQSKAAAFYVMNATAIGRLKVTRLQVVGEDAQAFQITGYKGMPVGTVASGDVRPSAMVQSSSTEALPFSLKFTPTHLGSHEAYVLVEHDGMNTSPLTLPLLGFGERDVAFMVSGGAGIVPLASFDATAVPQMVTRTVFLRNVGSAGLARYLGFALEGAPNFAVTSIGLVSRNSASVTPVKTYNPPRLADTFLLEGTDVLTAPTGKSDLAITVQTLMTERGTQSAVLTVFHDGPGEQTTLELVGGYYAPNLAFYAAQDLNIPIEGVGFANVELNIASTPYPVVLRNTGNVPVTLTASMLALPAGFSYTADSSCIATTLAPDATCELAIIFTPTKEQPYNAPLSVGDSAQHLSPVAITLQGQGTLARLEYWNEAQTGQLSELVFPATEIGTRSTATVVVKNSGSAELRITDEEILVAEPFEVMDTTCQEAVLQPGETCEIELAFAPLMGGKFEGSPWQLLLASNAVSNLSLPLKARTPPAPIVEVVAEGNHTFARKSDGTWWATGYNAQGQLGLGVGANLSSFTQNHALTGATQVVAGQLHTFARKADGTWWATGHNYYGQLGLGNTVNRSSFTQVPALTDATQVVAGGYHTLARKAEGTWGAAGDNELGSLGLGSTTNLSSFAQVPALTGATQVVAGLYHTFARKSDGTWWTTGRNAEGQLGLGDVTNRYSFTQVHALTGATQVVAGQHHTFARKSDGTWWATGYNYYGQLGLGDTTDRRSFAQVPALTGATQVVAGWYHTFARKSDGTWWATGYNAHGELGLGNTVSRTSFTQVPALTGATQVVAGQHHTFARKSDGTWWTTGRNAEGQLGLGDVTNRSSFTQVPEE